MSKTKNYTVVISSGELRGLTLLLLLLIVIIVFPLILKVSSNVRTEDIEFLDQEYSVKTTGDLKQFTESEPSPGHPEEKRIQNVNKADIEGLMSIGIPKRTAQTLINFRNKGKNFKSIEDIKKIYGMNDEILAGIQPYIIFGEETANPIEKRESHKKEPGNTGKNHQQLKFRQEQTERKYVNVGSKNKEDWMMAGLNESLSARISNYLSKGGSFKHPEDLLKIYGLDSSEWLEIVPYLDFETPVTKEEFITTAQKKEAEIPLRSVGINTATRDEWLKLPGINHGIITRIFNYRNRLGGFYNIEQIKEVYGMTDTLVEIIQPYLFEDEIIPEFYINQLSKEDLSGHPYISAKEAKLIIAFREQHGKFRSKDDLQKMFGLEKTTIERITPYLVF